MRVYIVRDRRQEYGPKGDLSGVLGTRNETCIHSDYGDDLPINDSYYLPLAEVMRSDEQEKDFLLRAHWLREQVRVTSESVMAMYALEATKRRKKTG